MSMAALTTKPSVAVMAAKAPSQRACLNFRCRLLCIELTASTHSYARVLAISDFSSCTSLINATFAELNVLHVNFQLIETMNTGELQNV